MMPHPTQGCTFSTRPSMHPPVIPCGRRRREPACPASWPAAERSIEQPAMIERLAIDVEQRTGPKIAGAIPHHVGEPQMGPRLAALAAVDVGADEPERRHDEKIVAAGTDHQLRRAQAAEI